MENKERIPDLKGIESEKSKESKESERESYPEVFTVENKEKNIESIRDGAYSTEEKREKKEDDLNEEDNKVRIKLEESQGASMGKIRKIINRIKRIFSPHDLDKYHDGLVKRKDDQ